MGSFSKMSTTETKMLKKFVQPKNGFINLSPRSSSVPPSEYRESPSVSGRSGVPSKSMATIPKSMAPSAPTRAQGLEYSNVQEEPDLESQEKRSAGSNKVLLWSIFLGVAALAIILVCVFCGGSKKFSLEQAQKDVLGGIDSIPSKKADAGRKLHLKGLFKSYFEGLKLYEKALFKEREVKSVKLIFGPKGKQPVLDVNNKNAFWEFAMKMKETSFTVDDELKVTFHFTDGKKVMVPTASVRNMLTYADVVKEGLAKRKQKKTTEKLLKIVSNATEKK